MSNSPSSSILRFSNIVNKLAANTCYLDGMTPDDISQACYEKIVSISDKLSSIAENDQYKYVKTCLHHHLVDKYKSQQALHNPCLVYDSDADHWTSDTPETSFFAKELGAMLSDWAESQSCDVRDDFLDKIDNGGIKRDSPRLSLHSWKIQKDRLKSFLENRGYEVV